MQKEFWRARLLDPDQTFFDQFGNRLRCFTSTSLHIDWTMLFLTRNRVLSALRHLTN